MSSLAQQLQDPQAAARTTLTHDLDSLRNAVTEAGLVLLEGDFKSIKGKQNFLNTLAQVAQIPEYFGCNWDALADALCDLSWQPANGYVLLMHNISPTLGLSASDREIAHDLLDDTIVFWQQRNKPFWVFLA